VNHALIYAKRYDTQSALVFIDLHKITNIDEMLGQTISQELLRRVAEQLQKCKRESDTLARFGFDKFALLLENLSSEREVETIIERINMTLSAPFHVDQHEFILQPQIGHCMCRPTCGAYESLEKVDVVRCYGCAMSTTASIKTGTVNAHENILAK